MIVPMPTATLRQTLLTVLIMAAASAPVGAQLTADAFPLGMVAEIEIDPGWSCGAVPLSVASASTDCRPIQLRVEYRTQSSSNWLTATLVNAADEYATQPISLQSGCEALEVKWLAHADVGYNIAEASRLRVRAFGNGDTSENVGISQLNLVTPYQTLSDFDFSLSDGVQGATLTGTLIPVLDSTNLEAAFATFSAPLPLVVNFDFIPQGHAQPVPTTTFALADGNYVAEPVQLDQVEQLPASFEVRVGNCDGTTTQSVGFVEVRSLRPIFNSTFPAVLHPNF